MIKMRWTVLMAKRKLYHLSFYPAIPGIADRYKYSFTKWENDLADVCAAISEIEKDKKDLCRVVKLDPFWPEEFTLWAIEYLDHAPRIAKRFYKLDLRNKSNKQLSNLLKELHDGLVDMGRTVIYLELDTRIQDDLEKFLFDILKDRKELVQVIEKITAPTRRSANAEQQLDFLRILVEYQKSGKVTKALEERMEDHIYNYAWVAMDTGHGAVLDKETLERELRRKGKLNAEGEIARISREYEDLKRERQKIFEDLRLPCHIKAFANYLSESTFIRTLRRYCQTQAAYYGKPLHDEIARRLGLTWEELNYLFPNEVYEALQEKVDPKVLKEKAETNKKCSVILLDRGKMKQFSGEEARKFIDAQTTDEEEAKKGVLHGRPVCLGKVKGTVRVVKFSKELKKVKKGDILVASQTPPDFIPGLKRAGAVVVDEGGVTSHASILCREYKVPCIIGTKVATKTFKDGDRVLVDATEGTAKKLDKTYG